MAFEKGIKGFFVGKGKIEASFPVDWEGKVDVCCMQCKFYNRVTGFCVITNEISEYPKHCTGSHCPLEFDGVFYEKEQKEQGENEKGAEE